MQALCSASPIAEHVERVLLQRRRFSEDRDSGSQKQVTAVSGPSIARSHTVIEVTGVKAEMMVEAKRR